MSKGSGILVSMWLATKHGFYSINLQGQGVYYVRARMERFGKSTAGERGGA